MKDILLQLLLTVAQRFITVDAIKSLSAAAVDKLLELAQTALEKGEENELELYLIELVKEIRNAE